MDTSPADSLHRLAKAALDSGQASSIVEAEGILRRLRIGFVIGEQEVREPTHQAALLTAVVLARRVFLGGVFVDGPVGVPLQVPMPLGSSLEEAIFALGASVTRFDESYPRVYVGGGSRERSAGFTVRMAYAGWRGGIIPGHSEITALGAEATPLAAMLSAALAVNEAFMYVRGDSNAAGHRSTGMSLWAPDATSDWTKDDGAPTLMFLPSRLWLIGLGHLGQAYLWALGLHDYPDPHNLSFILQDVDIITTSNESTSILTDRTMVGSRKTRAMARWAEARGFSATIHERLFDADFQRQSREPGIALCGVDNAVTRRALDQVGFDLIVEAGLGNDYQDFRTIRLHTLPAERLASDIWKGVPDLEVRESARAYKAMVADGILDQCGVTMLAGKAVGAPFVGAVAACLVMAELLRLLHGGPLHRMIDLDLCSIEQRIVVKQAGALPNLNPGFIDIRKN